MPYQKKNVRPGPKSAFNASLGNGINIGRSLPKAIHALIMEPLFRRLMNWMAMDPSFKKKILDQVPDEDPDEPSS